jgi:predicted unusual protein kinase regulating ubiquinone biosynthesis (AarF/ABC1/UbiB family)
VKFSLKPHHLKRYKDVARLFLKYSSLDFARDFELETVFEETRDTSVEHRSLPPAEELADDLEKMGPTFVKIGQLLSSRADLLPPAYLRALARLQDEVKPFSFAEVEQIINNELGVRLSKAFSSFDHEPLAAASLGQVHRAALRDNRPVVVKVQRPNIRPQVLEDFEVLEQIACFLDEHTKLGQRYQFGKIIEEFKSTVLHELDYEREAANLALVAENLKDFERIQVPLPVQDYTTHSILTMEYVPGIKITALSPLARLDIDGAGLADQLFKAYLKQVLVDGVFHADPHPGNIFLTDDGRLALLDLGMVGHTAPAMQEHLLKLLVAVSEGNGDEAIEIVLRISDTREDFNETDFRKRINHLVSEQRDSTLRQSDTGRTLMSVGKTASDTGLLVPSEFTLLGKTLLQLDEIGRILDADFNPNAAIKRNVSEILTQRIWKNSSPGKWLGTMLELKDFVGRLPRRVNKLLDAAANAELELKIKAPDTVHLLEGFQKIANRITTGLILAALIVGASLLMQVDTSFQIFGYPGLAILCFIAAAGGGVWLVLSILAQDYKDKRKSRH